MSKDTQFQGFAKLLFDETGKALSNAHMKQIIASLAYALVKHTIEHIDPIDLDRLSPDEHVARIPDLTELPKDE